MRLGLGLCLGFGCVGVNEPLPEAMEAVDKADPMHMLSGSRAESSSGNSTASWVWSAARFYTGPGGQDSHAHHIISDRFNEK